MDFNRVRQGIYSAIHDGLDYVFDSDPDYGAMADRTDGVQNGERGHPLSGAVPGKVFDALYSDKVRLILGGVGAIGLVGGTAGFLTYLDDSDYSWDIGGSAPDIQGTSDPFGVEWRLEPGERVGDFAEYVDRAYDGAVETGGEAIESGLRFYSENQDYMVEAVDVGIDFVNSVL